VTIVLKLTKAEFALLIGVINAANALLIPLILNTSVAAFTAIVLNLLIVYLSTEEQDAPAGTAPAGTPGQLVSVTRRVVVGNRSIKILWIRVHLLISGIRV
jgi:hypothetical protein